MTTEKRGMKWPKELPKTKSGMAALTRRMNAYFAKTPHQYMGCMWGCMCDCKLCLACNKPKDHEVHA